MVVTPPQEAEASQNAPPTITAWKKLPKDGDTIQAVRPVIDPSSWPTLADSSKKLIEPHSSESPSRSPTPETASPPPAKTLPESASSSSMATASTSDSDQPIKIDAPPPPQVPSHPRPSRSPAGQSQRSHHNQRSSSSSGGQRGNAFQNSNFVNRRQQQARPHEWNSGRRAFVPRSFNQNQQHYQYQPQGFGMQPAPMPIPHYPNTPTGTVPLYFAPPVQPPVVGYMLPYGYYGEQPFQDVYRPVYGSLSPYPDSIRAPGIPSVQLPGYTPQEDTDVCNALLAQIEYYFSDVNLETDDYLKGQMDEQGWVSVHLISGFKRVGHTHAKKSLTRIHLVLLGPPIDHLFVWVKRLTQDVNLILRALLPSTMVEVQGHKLRKRGNWMAWVSSPAQPTQNKLVTSMQSLQLDGDSRMEPRAAEMQPVDSHPTASAPKDGDLGKENLNTKGQWSC